MMRAKLEDKPMPKILLVDDEPDIIEIIQYHLEKEGYLVKTASNGIECLSIAKSFVPDLILLDVMMPVKDGFTVAKEIRQVDSEIPILFLTAKSMKEDKLAGFDVGADDYLTKPFAMEELLARINAILKRSYKEGKKETTFDVGDVNYDYLAQTVSISGDSKKLTTKENELFRR